MIDYKKTYLSYIDCTNLGEKNIQKTINLMSMSDRLRVSRFLRKEDQVRSIAGRFLLMNIIEHIGLSPQIIKNIEWSSQKKPYIKELKYFSISHSHNYVAIVYSNAPVGLDIEKEITTITIDDYSSVFSANELKLIYENTKPQLQFYKVWTKKESLLKVLGLGFLASSEDIEVIDDIVWVDKTKYHFTYFDDVVGYTMTMASPLEIKTIETVKI